jgi:hypothetical protein
MENNETVIERFSGGFFHALNPFAIPDELFAAIIIGLFVLIVLWGSLASEGSRGDVAQKSELRKQSVNPKDVQPSD